METALGLIIGIGLSAACGFRVFVPMLVVSAGIHAGVKYPELWRQRPSPASGSCTGA